MYYKILNDNELFVRFNSLKADIDAARAAAKKLVIKIGGEKYAPAPFVLAGGISGIESYPKPDNWVWVNRKACLCMPKEKKILDAIKELPIVPLSALQELVGYKSMFAHPGVIWRDEYVLVHLPETLMESFTKPDEFIEILYSEYCELKKEVAKVLDEA